MLLVISSPCYGKLLIGLPAGIPSHDMLNHVFRCLDPTEFRALPDPMGTKHHGPISGVATSVIDGK